MKKAFCMQKSKFVYTKDELGYQEVLDDFCNSQNITIITFDISLKHNYLMNCLNKAPDNSKIKIVTNIPQRWEVYYNENYKLLAKKKIGLYLTKLKPEAIGGKVSIFFNFNNHGKIIMTESLAYIGSENYSEESKNNIEFGVIVEDVDFIKFLIDEVIPDVEKSSVPYYSYKHMSLILQINMAISALFSLRNELYDEIYLWYDNHSGEDAYVYNTDYDLLSKSTLEKIETLMSNINDIIDGIKSNIEHDISALSNINVYNEKLISILASYSEQIWHEPVRCLANFSVEDYANDLLQTEYAMVADEEHLDECVEICMDAAHEKLDLLCERAKEDLDLTIDHLDEYMKIFQNFAEFFQRCDRVVNPIIDNSL